MTHMDSLSVLLRSSASPRSSGGVNGAHAPSRSELSPLSISPAPVALGADPPGDCAPAALYRRISWHLLPIFFLLNCLNYVDRANLAFASIQMSRQLRLQPAQYGIGAGLFFLGYSVCQLPSQLVLRRVGAPHWLATIVTAWGIIACCMAAVHNEASFYVVRTLLGAAEAGSFPAYWYYLTHFYPDKHIALPYSITDSAIMIAQVLGAPLAAALLHLDGLAGLAGWQWLFLFEGAPTALLGLTLVFLLPAAPAAARWLRGDEALLVQADVDACRGRHAALEHSQGHLLLKALSHRGMYLMGAVKFAKDLTTYATMFWAPMLIRSLLQRHKAGEDGCDNWDHDGARDGAPAGGTETGWLEVLLTGVPYSLAAVASIAMAWHSQRVGDRKWHIAIGYCAGGVALLLLPVLTAHSIPLGFVGLTAVIVLALCPNGCLLALASALGQGPALHLNLAVFNSVGNLAGLLGPWVMGYVVGRTCSYDAAFMVLGVVLIAGGALALTADDRGSGRGGASPRASGPVPVPATIALAELIDAWEAPGATAHNGAYHKAGAVDAVDDNLDEM